MPFNSPFCINNYIKRWRFKHPVKYPVNFGIYLKYVPSWGGRGREEILLSKVRPIAFKFNLSEIGNSALTKDMCFLVDRWIKVFAGKEYTNATTMYFDLYFSSLLIINFSHFY